jgi:hypothetical protein
MGGGVGSGDGATIDATSTPNTASASDLYLLYRYMRAAYVIEIIIPLQCQVGNFKASYDFVGVL